MLQWLKQSVGGGRSAKQVDTLLAQGPIDLTDAQTIASFKEISKDLRAQRPVCPVTSGGLLLTRADDVKAAFSNKLLSNQPSRFSALAPKNTKKYVAASVAANIPPFLDAPRHVEVRKWLSKCFFERFRAFEHQIEAIAQKHIDGIAPALPHLLVEEIARKFVVDVIGQFVGIDVAPDDMKQFTGALFRLFAPAADAETFKQTNVGLANARHQLIAALHQRRADQTDSLLKLLDLADLPDLGGTQKDTLIADNALLILADGVENVEAAIANVMMRLQNVGGDVNAEYVRETVTSDTPGQTIARVASQNMTVGGEKVSAGTPVFLSLASANDSTETAEDFSFGMGRHKCIGEQLAVAMISTFSRILADQKPEIDTSNLHYAMMFGHKWPRGVVLTIDG
ncbi:hypothetical protein [Planktotalea sp.]|uniref:hypothetical protein n=1 Tax=Planktotalea sp. TaxID=2029877 RepID=UPI003F6C6B67